MISTDKHVSVKEKGTRKKQLRLRRKATSSPSTKIPTQSANIETSALEKFQVFLNLGASHMEF